MPKKRIILILVSGVIVFLIIAIIDSLSPDTPIYYKYNGVTITRLDHIHGEAETHFFYGYYDGKKYSYPHSYIKVTYHGFDAMMDGYLIFLLNKKVELLSGYGLFEKVGNDASLYLREYYDSNGSVAQYDNWHDSIQGKYGSTEYFTCYPDSEEKSVNRMNNSFVKALYP